MIVMCLICLLYPIIFAFSSVGTVDANPSIKRPLRIVFASNVMCRLNQTANACPLNLPSVDGPGRKMLNAIVLAQRAINDDLSLKPFHNMTIDILNTQGYAKDTLRKVVDSSKFDDVLAIFGVEEQCEEAARTAEEKNKLLISHVCTTANKYSTFVQLTPSITKVADSMVAFLVSNQWPRVTVVNFFRESILDQFQIYQRLISLLPQVGIEVIKDYIIPIHDPLDGYLYDMFQPTANGDMIIDDILVESYLKTRVYILLGGTLDGQDIFYFLDQMSRMGLLQTGEYTVLVVYPNSFDGSAGTAKAPLTLVPVLNPLYVPMSDIPPQSYRSAIVFSDTQPDNASWQRFVGAMKEVSKEKPPCPPMCGLSFSPSATLAVQKPAAKLFESLLYFARLATRVLLENKTDIYDGYEMQKYFYSVYLNDTWSGVPLEIDGYDMAAGDTTVSTAMMGPDGALGVYAVGRYKQRSTGTGRQTKQIFYFNGNRSFNWVNSRAPPSGPRCGFAGDECKQAPEQKFWLIAIFGGIVVICAPPAAYLYRKRRREYAMEWERSTWRVFLKDLTYHNLETLNISKTSLNSVDSATSVSATNLQLRNSQAVLRSVQSLLQQEQEQVLKETQLHIAKKTPDEHLRTFEKTATALYKGRLVMLKRIKKPVNDQLDEETKKELHKITKTLHTNLDSFCGIVNEAGVLASVFEYCMRGSLKDVLETAENLMKDRIFQNSVIFDIIKGLKYLHSSWFKYHGRLKSSNCLIDNKWTVKLSDYGLFNFRNGEELPVKIHDRSYKRLWTAPEFLREIPEDERCWKVRGSPEGDVYAFGIILHEIFGRRGPFGNHFDHYTEVTRRVSYPTVNEPPYRPYLGDVHAAPECAKRVMQECWAEDPKVRPLIADVNEKLQPLKHGMSDNIMDNLLTMVKKYTGSLEEMIEERVSELEDEYEKAEALLGMMLPKKVAEALKYGKEVEPERFDEVTIYFSDIVGFDKIAKANGTHRLVAFLHETFSIMDQIITKFDVYKVETIGDTYMVASGLPHRNGHNHSGEIASMALNMRAAALEQKIKTPSGDTVQLRIGMHSGSCVAGVVGLIMPRYCLFGDTVNSASRMESTGQPFKIHLSAACRRELNNLGGYETVERGIVFVKGKGEMVTYWLLSEDPEYRAKRLRFHLPKI